MAHATTEAMTAGLDQVRAAPGDGGTVELVVSRPRVDGRDVLEVGDLSVEHGLVGDTWADRGSRHTEDGSAEPGRQVTIMSARAAALIAGPVERWPLAGDQLFVDLDLSHDNLPAGTRLAVGEAVVEISVEPHNGCAKFASRYGQDAVRFVNSPDGKALRLRGLNARVVRSGAVRPGDVVAKVADGT